MNQSEAWQPPPQRLPRQRYSQHWDNNKSGGSWGATDVMIVDHDLVHEHASDDELVVARYRRNYHGQPPFEPFRQRDRETGEWRHYALVSGDYTATSVLLLDAPVSAMKQKYDSAQSRIASIPVAGEQPDAFGFCPVGFYVPDWHDVHDGSILPGSEYWNDNRMWPDGSLGFVWGCTWADDSDWKVQALDLSRVQDGVITRDDRWGYLRLDTVSDDPKDFIRVHSGFAGAEPTVTFSVPRTYSITGNFLSGGGLE